MPYPNKLTRAAACLTVVLAVVACAKREESGERHNDAVMAAAPAAEPSAPPPPPSPSAKPSQNALTTATTAQQMGSSAATFVDGERKFIRKASARFNVKDVYAAALGIEDIVATNGGFVVSNDITTASVNSESHPIGDGKLLELNEYKVQGKLVVRVPSAKTQDFLRAIVGHIVFLDQRSFSARDAQFDLLQRQLAAIRNQETQTDLGETVQEGGKLAQRAEVITARGEAKGARDAALLEKKQFEDEVAFSTIELDLYQQSKVIQTERVDISAMFRQARPGFFSRMGESLNVGWTGLLDFLLVLVRIWPVLLIGSLVAAAIWRLKRKNARPD